MSDSFPISSKKKNARSEAIGFSRGLLSEEPLRIEVLADTPDFIALNKPANISLRQHPWDENIPNLDSALNLQLKEGKPEKREKNTCKFKKERGKQEHTKKTNKHNKNNNNNSGNT